MANIKEFTSGVMWGAGIAIVVNAALGLAVKSNTFPVLTQFFEIAKQKGLN